MKKYWFHPDRECPGFGWVCIWEFVDGLRLAKSLDYIRKSAWDKLDK